MPGWHLNVLPTHIPLGEDTADFLDALSLAFRRLSLLAHTIIIGDLNAAPTDNNCTGPPTAIDVAVRGAVHQLGLTYQTAGLTGTSSHWPHHAGTLPSRIDTCYGDWTTVRVHEATYGDLPPAGTGHQPLYVDLIITTPPQSAATEPGDTLPTPLKFPLEDNHGPWHKYNRGLHVILCRHDAPTLTTAMRQAACACGIERDTNSTEAPPGLILQQLVNDIWTTGEDLARLQKPHKRDAHLCVFLTTCCRELQEWHAQRMAAAAQEPERYGKKDTPYKSLRYVSCILEDTGCHIIHAVRTTDGGLTSDPDAVLRAVLDSIQAQHGDAFPTLHPHTRSTIHNNIPQVFNRQQRCGIQRTAFSIPGLQRALSRKKKGGRARHGRATGQSISTPPPAHQAPPGRPPVGHRHGSQTHPPRVGQPGPSPPQEGGLGTARKLAANCMRHQRAVAGVDTAPGPHRASGLCPSAYQHAGGHGRQVSPQGHFPPAQCDRYQPLRDDCRLPHCPRRVPPRTAAAPHQSMGCHGPPVPTLHDRVHPDLVLRRHQGCWPYPVYLAQTVGTHRVAPKALSSTFSSSSRLCLNSHGNTWHTPHTH